MVKTSFPKALFLFFLILTISSLGFAKKDVISSHWTVIPQKIDGSSSDWADDVLNSEKKVSVDYAFRNDTENLYVLFVFKDRESFSSVQATGMTLWFNTEGKKKKDYGIKFIQKQITAEDYIALVENKSGPLSEDQKSKLRANQSYNLFDHEVINKKAKSSQVPGELKFKPAGFRFKRQQGTVVYEFVVPLKKVHELAPGIGTEPGSAMKVCFEWGGTTKEMKEAMMRRRAESGTSATAGGATGLREERRIRSSDRPFRAGAKKYSIWMDVQLAQNQ